LPLDNEIQPSKKGKQQTGDLVRYQIVNDGNTLKPDLRRLEDTDNSEPFD